ncbi:copper resistance CopC family protein [Mycolicibacterium parafortuitum]|uniref:Putative copper resistance protein [Nocardia brasiliensis ATCC] n=1 Tax=Mycolicibacterium parafortuitum TaxID=39692 RepID=A0A375YCN2_MYCPF|nr:copper resistance CopC family protein [Mycolicibacterium parafortuitum]SRX78882.1 putative copper resistance protein [Nocardia brasiliensis ATCC] [Mycolicibacterium parafortuitum]
MTAIPRARHALTLVLLVLGLIAGGFGFAATAGAHAALIGSDPADGAELAQQPTRISATFNEPMQPQFAAMTVIGPDGALWSDGEPTVDGAVISVAVRSGGPAGTYTVNYRATSADGHVVKGSWGYRVLTAPQTGTAAKPRVQTGGAPAATPETTATPAVPAAAPESDEMPVWPFVAGVTVIVAAGALWAVRRRS